jgi:hypothetical protein
MTLSDDEKAHIRAEEEFRANLRSEFAEAKPNRAWKFLNSAFGLWLLGSVSLAVVTFSYQKLELSYKAAVERDEMRNKVREELRTRFEVAAYYLQLDTAQPCIKNPDQPPTPELVNLILREASGEDGGPYEEFRKVSATALFSRLAEQQPTIARTHWIYLEPKLRARAIQPQLAVPLKCDELSRRLVLIAESFR